MKLYIENKNTTFSQSESLFFYGLFSFIPKIPKGHVWLLGDNPNYSKDSRDYGPVPYGLIRGRACFKVRFKPCDWNSTFYFY